MSTSMIQDLPTTTEQQDRDHETTMTTTMSNTGASVALIAALIGGVAGALLFVFVSTLIPLLLVLVWMIKKHKLRIAVNKAQYHLDHHQEPQLEGSEQMSEEQHQDDGDMEMNDAYISSTQILTTDNVAYHCQATPHARMLTVDIVADEYYDYIY